LLAKLHFSGIRRVSEDWFRSYLTNERQKEVKLPAQLQLKLFSLTGVY